MKDRFGVECEKGDLVVQGYMEAIIIDVKEQTIFHRHGRAKALNNSFIRLMPGVCPEWDMQRQKLIDLYSDEVTAKRDRLTKRIKKNEFERYGVYVTDDDPWTAEIYLGPCAIGTRVYENAWAGISFTRAARTNNKYTKEFAMKLEELLCQNDIDYTVKPPTIKGVRPRYGNIRDCKYPLKHKKLFSYEADEVLTVADIVPEVMEYELKEKLWT